MDIAQALEEILEKTTESSRDYAVVGRRLGWLDATIDTGPMRLQYIGDLFELTRERVRQIQHATEARLKKVSAPKALAPALDALAQAAPINVKDAAQLLVDKGLSTRPVNPEGLLEAARIFGVEHPLQVRRVRGERLLFTRATSRADTPLKALMQAVNKDVSNYGLGRLERVLEMLPPATMTPDQLRETLEVIPGLTFLDEGKSWFALKTARRGRLRSLLDKLFSMGLPLTLFSIQEALARAYKQHGLNDLPPSEVLAAYIDLQPQVWRREGDMVKAVKPRRAAELLNPVEQVFRSSLQRAGGVATREQLVETAEAAGVSINTINCYLSRSPILARLKDGRWALRGTQPEAERGGEAKRRASVLQDVSMSANGRLRLVYRASPVSLQSGIFSVPSVLRDRLAGRSLKLLDKSGAPTGTAVTVDKRGTLLWNLREPLKALHVRAGQEFSLEIDPMAETAQVEPAA